MSTYVFRNRTCSVCRYECQADDELAAREELALLLDGLVSEGLWLPTGQWYLEARSYG